MEIQTQNQQSGLSLFDNGTFEQMMKIASAVGKSPLIPQTLKGGNTEETQANCLLVVEQSHRWGLSPFAVMQCASVIHGRLMWEGKLVAAVLASKLGVNLSYEYHDSGQARKVIVSGRLPDEDKTRTIEGTVQAWATSGNGSPWKDPANHDRQLAYRGAREWARRHAPSVMLGVVTEDEAEPQPGMRNVTQSIRREEPLTLGGDEPQERPEPTKTKATGRQKKDRHHRNVEFIDITERTGNGKTWWVVIMNIGASSVEMGTFSKSIAEALFDTERGQGLKITFTKNDKGYQLEDFEVLENSNVEGEIC